MDKILGFLTAFLVLFFAPITGKTQIPFNGCIDFENLAPGPRTGNDSVRVGDYLLSTPSYLVTFDSAKDVGGDLVFNNFEVIENGLFELGNGRYIFINGALRFDFGSRKVCRVELKYFGSSFSIGVNDKAIHSFSISDFIRIPTNLFPGVHIIVHPDPLKPYQGTLVLEGEIYNFHFGGTEIQLDDVCFTFCQTDPCVISDIQLDVNLCDVNGNFYVDLDLEYAGTGDSFQILLGGNTLTYAYNDLPLSLGPFDSTFPGSSNGDVIQLGGVVWDNNNRVCSRQFGVFDTIYCDYACAFDSIEADITECHPDGSYDVSINFNYQNSIHDTFGVYVGGQFYGLHLYADLPLQISNIAQPGGTKIPVTIFEYYQGAPTGPGFSCQSTVYLDYTCFNCYPRLEAVVVDGPNADGKYKLSVSYIPKLNNFGFTQVYLNDIWVDSFLPAQNQFFLNLNCDDFSDTVAVRLADAGNPDCVSETSYIVNCPDTNTCAINDLNAVISCTADLSIFQITFTPQNAAGYGFDVWVDQTYYGFYQYSNLNAPQMLTLTVTNTGEPTYEVKVCDSDNPDCCAFITLDNPCAFTNCNIRDLKVEATLCDPSGNFYFIVRPIITPGINDTFEIYVNGVLVGTYDAVSVGNGLRVGPYNGVPARTYEITVRSLNDPACAKAVSIIAGCANLNCRISDLIVEPYDCDDTGRFKVDINFDYQNTSDSFHVIVNGQSHGYFAYTQVPITLDGFIGNGQAVYVFRIEDQQSRDCGQVFTVLSPNCTQDCDISNIITEISDCVGDEFYFKLNFNHQATNDTFFLFAPGSTTIIARYAYADLPVRLGPFIGNGQGLVFIIKDSRNGDCAADFRITSPNCTSPCDLSNIQTDISDCVNGEFTIFLKFDHQNTSDSFFLFAGNSTTMMSRHAYSDLPVRLGPFPGNGQSLFFLIRDSRTPNCAADFRITAPDCQPRCNISDLRVDVGDCDQAGQFTVKLNFNHQNTADSFMVVGNGRSYGVFAYADLPVTLGPLDGDGVTEYEFVVIDKRNPDCRNHIVIDPVYCGDDCKIYNVNLEALPCDNNGNFKIALSFDYQNTSGIGFLVFADGKLFGPYPANQQQPIILSPFVADGRTVYDILILDQGNALCFAYGEIGPIECGDCKISNLQTRVTDCNNLGEFYIWLDFDHEFTGNQGFSVRGNGMNYGSFNYNQLPVKLGPFRGDGRSVYELVVVDNAHPDCRNETQVGPVSCFNAPCRILDINAAATDCTPNGIFFVDLKFNYQNVGNQGFSVRGNGRNYGRFLYDQLPVRLGPFVGDGRTIYEFIVYDNQFPDCHNVATVGPVNCDSSSCQITDLTVRTGNCNNDGTYKITLDFNVRSSTNALFDVFTPRGHLGTFRLSDLPVTINNFPASRNAFDILEVCINDNARCCASIQFAAPRCQHDCIDFEAQAIGTFPRSNSNINDTLFLENGVTVRSGGFLPSTSGIRFDSISIDTANVFFDAAMGHQITTWNSTILFQFPRIAVTPCVEITLDYFQIGAENNISINGMPVFIFERFTELPQNLHGVRIEVNPVNPREGRLVLRGYIESLRIGGNQLSIDNLCYKPCQNTSAVWPGDANLDNVTSHYDLLNIGLAFGKEEIQRAQISTEWEGFDGEDWIRKFGNSVNLKNADCDGDGKVDADDVKAIVKNYGKMHGDILASPKIPVAPNSASLFIEFPEAATVEAGRPFKATVVLGTEDTPVQNIYGLAFTLRYDPSRFRIQNIQYPPSWFGEPGEDVLTIDKIFESSGIAHVALTRNDFENVSGSGAIVEIIGIIDNIAGRVTEIEIDISDVVAISKNELLLPVLTPKNLLDLSTSTDDLLFENQVSVFPNPATGKIFIKTPDNQPVESVQIYRVDGVLIENDRPQNGILNVSRLSPGLYVLKMQIGERTVIKRIVKKDL